MARRPDRLSHREVSRVVARVGQRLVVTVDGDVVDGSAQQGESIVSEQRLDRGRLEVRRKVAGGLPVKETGPTDKDEEEARVPFLLCLDGADYQPPYSGWLGRLLVIEGLSEPRLFAIPHDPKFAGYKEAFGCFLIWGHSPCKAQATCRNEYGKAPCQAPPGFECDGTFATCKDRANFAPCPHRFGEPPCPADPNDEPCQHSARTCRALGKGLWPRFGDSIYSAFGLCRNTFSTCRSKASFLPFSPEMHIYCQPRTSPPYQLWLAAKVGRKFVWLGQSDDRLSPAKEGEEFRVGRVWIATGSTTKLGREVACLRVDAIPCQAMLDLMRSTSQATGVGVADVSYAAPGGGAETRSRHWIASVQWLTCKGAQEKEMESRIVINGSPDGLDWSEDGKVVATDEISVEEESGSERTEYRAPRVVVAGGELFVYMLKGRIRWHAEQTAEGGVKRIYDEMWIRLACNGRECTFDPPILCEGYIPGWPDEPEGRIVETEDTPVGTAVSTFYFRHGGSGWPAGEYEVIHQGGRFHLFVPVRVVVGRKKRLGRTRPIVAPFLMHFVSDDGASFVGGRTVKDRAGRALVCANSVPVCASWNGKTCTRRDRFCGIEGADGRFVSLYPGCDGQGTGGHPGGTRWSRYEPAAYLAAPATMRRSQVKGTGPPFALPGCDQKGRFACKLMMSSYQGQWCAQISCPGFEPRGLWGSTGLRLLRIRSDEL